MRHARVAHDPKDVVRIVEGRRGQVPVRSELVIRFDYGSEVPWVQWDDGGVTAVFEDGSTANGDVLVGADGAGSRVRKQYLPHAALEETGIVSIGAKVPLTIETKALLRKRCRP